MSAGLLAAVSPKREPRRLAGATTRAKPPINPRRMRRPIAIAPPAWLEQLAVGWRAYVLIGAIALISSLFGAAALPVMDRDEARFTQATRQMLETGDYVRIRVQQDDRNKKPIGIHWLQAAAVEAASPVTARLNDIWPYRLPSALGAALAAIATLWAGTALVGARAAFLGAALFSAGVLLGFEGMTAKTDAVLCGLTALAMAALARLRLFETSPPGADALFRGAKSLSLVFWIALGCGVLIKGPVTPMVAGLTIVALCFWERRWDWIKPLAWWPGPVLAAVIVAPWMIAIGAATDGRFFAEALGEDLAPKLAGGAEGHLSPPGYHLLLLAFLIFPATFALPSAARLGWRVLRAPRTDEANTGERFLLAWIIPTFLAFEALPTKLAHYTLPTFPALALLCGAAIAATQREHWRITHLIGVILFAIAGAGIVAVIATGATFIPGDSAADMRRAITAGVVGALILGAAIFALVSQRQIIRVSAVVLAALALSYTLRDRILPEARTLHVSAEAVAALARARLTPNDARPLWVVGYRETSLVFMTRTSIRLATPEEAAAQIRPGDTLMVENRDLAATEAELAQRNLFYVREPHPVQGLNYGNGKRVALYVGEVQRAPSRRQ